MTLEGVMTHRLKTTKIDQLEAGRRTHKRMWIPVEKLMGEFAD